MAEYVADFNDDVLFYDSGFRYINFDSFDFEYEKNLSSKDNNSRNKICGPNSRHQKLKTQLVWVVELFKATFIGTGLSN